MRRNRPLTEIQIPITVIRVIMDDGGGLVVVVHGVFIGSNDPAIHPDGGSVNRCGGGDVLRLDLDFHTTETLPVSPLQDKVRRRRLLLGGGDGDGGGLRFRPQQQ